MLTFIISVVMNVVLVDLLILVASRPVSEPVGG